MSKSNIITQACVYLNITKQAKYKPNKELLWGKSVIIHDRPSKMVPEQFSASYIVVFYNYKAVRNILESVYKKAHVKYQLLFSFLAELWQKIYFLRTQWRDIDILEKLVK